MLVSRIGAESRVPPCAGHSHTISGAGRIVGVPLTPNTESAGRGRSRVRSVRWLRISEDVERRIRGNLNAEFNFTERRNSRRAGGTRPDRPPSQHGRGPDVLHGPQEPDDPSRPRRVRRRPGAAAGECDIGSGAVAAARLSEARGAQAAAGVPVHGVGGTGTGGGPVDLNASQALADAMWRRRLQPEGSGLVPPGMNESSSVEELRDPSQPASERVEALPAFLGAGNPAVAPRCYDCETQQRRSMCHGAGRGATHRKTGVFRSRGCSSCVTPAGPGRFPADRPSGKRPSRS